MVSCRPVIWILTAGLLLASCRSFESDTPTPDSGIEETSVPETSTPAPDYVTRLRNAEYQLSFVDSLRIVQLTDGKFEQGAAGGCVTLSTTIFVPKYSID
jgi:hypothetical protein